MCPGLAIPELTYAPTKAVTEMADGCSDVLKEISQVNQRSLKGFWEDLGGFSGRRRPTPPKGLDSTFCACIKTELWHHNMKEVILVLPDVARLCLNVSECYTRSRLKKFGHLSDCW